MKIFFTQLLSYLSELTIQYLKYIIKNIEFASSRFVSTRKVCKETRRVLEL